MKIQQYNRKILELKIEQIAMLKEFKSSKYFVPIMSIVDEAWNGIVNKVIDDDDSKTIHMNRASMKLIRRLRKLFDNIDANYDKIIEMLNE